MVEAAKIVEEAKPDVIDINFGCPVKKVASKGAGAGMLQNIPKLLDILHSILKPMSVTSSIGARKRGRGGRGVFPIFMLCVGGNEE